MRFIIISICAITLVGNALAVDLSAHSVTEKHNTHVGLNPGTPDGREGGETIATAVVIAELPYFDTGNTSDNSSDHEADCVYGPGVSPDVIYSYTPLENESISVDLCGSGFDTRISILLENEQLIICNDDYYNDEECGTFTSKIEEAFLNGGTTYYIMIDGYNGDSGDYVLNVAANELPPPCDLTCDGTTENEPPLADGYDDLFNSGCNSSTGEYNFQSLQGDEEGELVFCGVSGWYDFSGYHYRDTDWFTAIIGSGGVIEWTLDAEFESEGYLLGPLDCAVVNVVDSIIAGPCAPATLIIEGVPGDLVWLWAGPIDFTPPDGFAGNEYNYVSTFSGLQQGTVSTERTSFDALKSLYRNVTR